MKSSVEKVYLEHKRERFRYDTKGKNGGCSAHGPGEECGGNADRDALLRREDGTLITYGACQRWVDTNPDAAEYVRLHGYVVD
jgi:hypothetical protein